MKKPVAVFKVRQMRETQNQSTAKPVSRSFAEERELNQLLAERNGFFF